ncbi:YihY/virulence factor BrkB family protein [Microbacterium protaetiae]|uniref:YihY/virulence factor BrkB family protein n=1 Tax=Microbacterium protaetiae TaxID=2509458 RepID=UPI001F5C3222|nr:YihY/virulence factor BrkB family protein [Microbacterium protaetiae]
MREKIRKLTAWALSLRLVRTFLHYTEHRGPMLADAITYRALFSVFAAVLLGFSIAGVWLAGNPDAMDRLTSTVDQVIPGLVGEDGLVTPSAVSAPNALTIAGIVALVSLVGAALGAIGAARNALRTIADRGHNDLFFAWVLLRNLGLAVALAIGIALSAAATFVVGILADTVRDAVGPSVAGLAAVGTHVAAVLVIFVFDAALVVLMFVVLSGVRAPTRALIGGAVLGGIGLTVLQQLSTLFVRGAASNPLLASFASLIALLLWMNLSAQVLLLASSYIVVASAEHDDRVRARYGAPTMAHRRVQRAEDQVALAVAELDQARAAEQASDNGETTRSADAD